MAYHNGSVWPHDNALIAAGLARYGYKSEALKILGALFDAANYMELNRLPELYCGFHKRSDVEGPTLYPVACAPQAWAAGSVYLLLESCLGIVLQPANHRVEFSHPQLPREIDWLELNNLRVGRGSVDLRLRRVSGEITLELLRNEGGCQVHIKH
jgi:glycogen debranching enzyme